MKIIVRGGLSRLIIAILSVSVFPTLCFADQHGNTRQKVGLVLSGGGARGAAHVGVIKVLDELGIPVDYIAGTSMGAIVGGLYASGMSAAKLEEIISGADWPQLLSDKPPRSRRTLRRKDDDAGFLVDYEMGLRKRKLLFPKGLIQGQTLSMELRKLLVNVSMIDDFNQLPIPFRAIAADIETGEEVVLSAGDLVMSIRASMSVPGIFKPAKINGNSLVDGGIANNLPINIVKEMGADLVIVVDVGTKPVALTELDSPIKITSQMLSILINKLSDQQKMLMSASDVLISPALGQMSNTAFEQVRHAIHIGERSARDSTQALARLSLSSDAYADHRLAVQQSRRAVPVINSIAIDNQSRLSTVALQTRLSNHTGKTLDPLLLEDEIIDIYGIDTFETVDYSVITTEAGNQLRIASKSKDWGPNYVRFGVNLEDDFRGNSNYNLAARLTRTEINRLGGEIRADIVLGESPEFLLEWYQPLDFASRWFVNPRIQYLNTSSSLFEDRNQLALLRSKSTNYSIGLGRNFSNASELRFSLTRSSSNGEIRIGDPALRHDSSNITSFNLVYRHDNIDDIAIPRHGNLFVVNWGGAREGFGADESFDLMSVFLLKPITWGRNTLLSWWDLNSVINQAETPFEAFNLGGFFNLSGYSPGELTGQHSAMGRLIYYRRVGESIRAYWIARFTSEHQSKPAMFGKTETILASTTSYSRAVPLLSLIR